MHVDGQERACFVGDQVLDQIRIDGVITEQNIAQHRNPAALADGAGGSKISELPTVMTSSPATMPQARKARNKPTVPECTATAWFC